MDIAVAAVRPSADVSIAERGAAMEVGLMLFAANVSILSVLGQVAADKRARLFGGRPWSGDTRLNAEWGIGGDADGVCVVLDNRLIG